MFLLIVHHGIAWGFQWEFSFFWGPFQGAMLIFGDVCFFLPFTVFALNPNNQPFM